MKEIKREYLTTETAAHLLGVSISTMKRWRKSGEGPTFYKLGRSVRYTYQDLKEWAKHNQGSVNRSVGAY